MACMETLPVPVQYKSGYMVQYVLSLKTKQKIKHNFKTAPNFEGHTVAKISTSDYCSANAEYNQTKF
jgi:hypothetical protein